MTTVINCRTQRGQMQEATAKGAYVYVGRDPHDLGQWGNRYTHLDSKVPGVVKVKTREEAIERHRAEVLADKTYVSMIRGALKDKVLGCWCAPLPCHADTLAAIANGELK